MDAWEKRLLLLKDQEDIEDQTEKIKEQLKNI